MDVFSVKRAIHSSILCVLFHSVVANSCPHDPGIFITPLNLEGLSGSCLLIPCNFRVKEGGEQFPGQNAAAVWIKSQSQFQYPHSKYVLFNSSRRGYVNYPMEIIGELNQKNCTTVLNNLKSNNTDKHFFRVEDGNFRSTASCSPVDITVRDSAWSPSIEVSGAQTESEVVTITCKAVTPCPREPPVLTWDLHQGTANINETNSDGTFTTKITQTVTLTFAHDGYNVTCSAVYPVNGGRDFKRAQTTITLNVTRTDAGKTTGNIANWLPAVIALIVLIVALVLIWHFKFRRGHVQPPQVQTIEQGVEQEQTEDGLHYEDLRFSGKKPNMVINSPQEETLYSQVKVSNHGITEMVDIYSQVKNI